MMIERNRERSNLINLCIRILLLVSRNRKIEINFFLHCQKFSNYKISVLFLHGFALKPSCHTINLKQNLLKPKKLKVYLENNILYKFKNFFRCSQFTNSIIIKHDLKVIELKIKLNHFRCAKIGKDKLTLFKSSNQRTRFLRLV